MQERVGKCESLLLLRTHSHLKLLSETKTHSFGKAVDHKRAVPKSGHPAVKTRSQRRRARSHSDSTQFDCENKSENASEKFRFCPFCPAAALAFSYARAKYPQTAGVSAHSPLQNSPRTSKTFSHSLALSPKP